MPELTALLAAVEQNNTALEGLATDVTDLRVEIGNLPDKYLPREEARNEKRKIKRSIGALAIGGLVVASTLGATLFLNHGVTCGVRGILVSAQTASTRNPLPNDLTPQQRADAESRRAMANEFYKDSLEKLNIIWPCAGESTP